MTQDQYSDYGELDRVGRAGHAAIHPAAGATRPRRCGGR